MQKLLTISTLLTLVFIFTLSLFHDNKAYAYPYIPKLNIDGFKFSTSQLQYNESVTLDIRGEIEQGLYSSQTEFYITHEPELKYVRTSSEHITCSDPYTKINSNILVCKFLPSNQNNKIDAKLKFINANNSGVTKYKTVALASLSVLDFSNYVEFDVHPDYPTSNSLTIYSANQKYMNSGW